jgi:predicted nucleic acid-binding Zn ribbon protein
MVKFDFICDQCKEKWEFEITISMADKIYPHCPNCEKPLRKIYKFPMAQVWSGKFHDRWYQIQDHDGLGSTW